MSWKPAPVIGGAYSDDAKSWSCQDTVNWIPVAAERPGGRSPTMLRGVPGMRTFCITGSNKPIRGARNVEGLLLVVTGTTLYKVSTKGAATAIGTIPGVDRVSMSHNQIAGGNEVAIANGQSGYVYNTVTGTLAQITDEGFPGAISFDFIDGYITGIEPARRFAFHSNLAAATDYNTLDRYEAEGSPDKLVGQMVDHREWWLFSERTIEPFVNTGAATNTFQRASNTMIEVGCASGASIAQMDSSVFWCGNDGIVYRANGYTPTRISTSALEQALARCNLAQCFAFTFEDRGHKIYYLTCPDGQTWGYDAATGEWHRRQSEGLTRWRINTLTKWNGVWIAGDYTNGKLYELNWDVQDEDAAVLERRRVTGVLANNQNRITVDGVALVFDTGTTAEPKLLLPPLTLSGDMPDGAIGDSASYQYAVSGGVLPNALSISAGALPPGLSMNASGLVTGTRTTAGSYTWTVRATDANGQFVDLAQAATVSGIVIGLLHFDADMTTDATGRVWTVKPWTEGIGYAPWLTWPQWDGSTYASAPGSFRMSRAGTAQSPEQGFYYGQARMYSALGTDGAIDSTTDFCIEGFVRRDPGDDGYINTMFLGFGIQLFGWQSYPSTLRQVTLYKLPTGMVATYNSGVDRTIPTDRFIHFALVREGATITLWWGGQAAATVSNAQLLTLASTDSVTLGNSNDTSTSYQMPGWLDEIRITKGWARYTQAFTPPRGRIA